MEVTTPEAHFLLQGRTLPVADSKATQFIGFAFGSSPNNTVEVCMLFHTVFKVVFILLCRPVAY